MFIPTLLLSFLCLSLSDPGAPWTEEESLIVKAKIYSIMGSSVKRAEEYLSNHKEEREAELHEYVTMIRQVYKDDDDDDDDNDDYGDYDDGDDDHDDDDDYTADDDGNRRDQPEWKWPEWPEPASRPNAPKFIRLGFHQCLKNSDGTGGCNGCLNNHGIYKYKGIIQCPLH